MEKEIRIEESLVIARGTKLMEFITDQVHDILEEAASRMSPDEHDRVVAHLSLCLLSAYHEAAQEILERMAP